MTSKKGSNSDVNGPGPHDADAISTLYEVVAQHWAHAEQLRWTLLYNYSVTSTILVLAWAAVFAASCGGRRLILLTLSTAGLLVTVLWLILQIRANGFVHMYEEAGLQAERSLAPSRSGSFGRGEVYRESFGWWKKHLGTRFIAPTVLLIFAILYAVLVFVSCRN